MYHQKIIIFTQILKFKLFNIYTQIIYTQILTQWSKNLRFKIRILF